jgi:endonuclease YncB( thermonuclease family)
MCRPRTSGEIMSAGPGWYQDPGQPPGHLRYWDGSGWTSHAAVPPPRAADQGIVPPPRVASDPIATVEVVAQPESSAPTKGWMRRHKLATASLALATIALLGAIFGDDDGKDPAGTDASATGNDATEPEADPSPDPRADDKPVKQGPKRSPTFLVTRIVDGDTIDLGNGETVRLVGIDTAEAGECGYLKASENLSTLILGKRVRLTLSDEDRDQYGRLLRYVDVGPVDAGLRQIKDGYAIARYDSRDGYGYHPREPVYIRVDKASPDFTCPKPPRLAGVGNCAPGYDPCIPPFPPDRDCADVNGPIKVTGSDPHGLDADGDGIACE